MIPYSKLPLFSVTSSIFNPILRNNIVEEDKAGLDCKDDSTEVTQEIQDIQGYDPVNLRQLQELPEISEGSDLEQEIRQASQLLLMAMRNQQDKEYGGDEKLRRVLIVHSLSRVLLAAMPQHLTEAEICELRASLPPEVLDLPHLMDEKPYIPQNKLEQIVVTVVRAFFIGLKTAAPYTKQILLALAREERKYKVSEKLIATGLATVEVLCGSTLGRAVISRSQGVAGAVFRGVSHGMAVMMIDMREQPNKTTYTRHRKTASSAY